MKKTVSIILLFITVFSLFACSGKSGGENSGNGVQSNGKVADPAQAKDFTSQIKWESEGIELCLPADREGNLFSDCGLKCMVTADCYDGDVVAYHEYDKECESVKKTVGGHTFDYQSFDYLGLKDWHMFVIRIAFTESRNQMEHRYYKIVYTVYGSEYPESQVEKFMATLYFPWFDKKD